QERYIRQWHFAATANAFTYRAVFDRVGLFDRNLASGADLEWGTRVFRAGFAQVYAHDASVAHAARPTLQELAAKHTRVVSGLLQTSRHNGDGWLRRVADLTRDWPTPRDALALYTSPALATTTQRLRALAVMGYVKLVRCRVRMFG
ncbi:MAG TPA: hypothetical protein VMT89_12575, partial [Candidatus Acidoferrales bacterium]|nr:hypothetical protein [Candidatus Acidoferrales bacterium]